MDFAGESSGLLLMQEFALLAMEYINFVSLAFVFKKSVLILLIPLVLCRSRVLQYFKS